MTKLENTSKMTRIPSCNFAYRIQQREKSNFPKSITPMTLYLSFWSDDF